jgi:hypothetical protein
MEITNRGCATLASLRRPTMAKGSNPYLAAIITYFLPWSTNITTMQSYVRLERVISSRKRRTLLSTTLEYGIIVTLLGEQSHSLHESLTYGLFSRAGLVAMMLQSRFLSKSGAAFVIG